MVLRSHPLLLGLGAVALLLVVLARGRTELYRVYSLSPNQVLANTARLEGKEFSVTGGVGRDSTGLWLQVGGVRHLGLARPDRALLACSAGEEVIVEVRQEAGVLVVVRTHVYRGLARDRVAWSLLPVPLIALVFCLEFRFSGWRFVRRSR